MNNEQTRQEFEAWQKEFFTFPLDLSRNSAGHYEIGLTAEKYATWLAGFIKGVTAASNGNVLVNTGDSEAEFVRQGDEGGEYLAYVESAIKDAGYEIQHDGGCLSEANVRLVRKRDREADRQRFRNPKFNAYLDQAITENGEFTTWDQIDNVSDAWYGYQAGLHDASPGPFDTPSIDLWQLHPFIALATAVVHYGDESPMKNGVFAEAERLLALIDKANH